MPGSWGFSKTGNFLSAEEHPDCQQKSKDSELADPQVTCSWRLCGTDSNVWYDEFILHAAGKLSIFAHLLISNILTLQGELKHHTGKSRFACTSCKVFIPQLASIERHQAHIHHIWSKLVDLSMKWKESLPNKLEDHYHIGQTQDFPEDLMLFVRNNLDDPLMQVCEILSISCRLIWMADHCGHLKDCIFQLKVHLLPHVWALHEVDMDSEVVNWDAEEVEHLSTLNQVVFKRDCIYCHHLFHINYTMYDVHCAQDTIHPCIDHCDILLLAPLDSPHSFLYVCILGIFHVNVIYTGPGVKEYLPRCLEFLWVRCFEVVDVLAGWEHLALDLLIFTLMSQDDAYGFVDPANVLQSYHLIPAFTSGKMHPDGVPVSWNARDGADWKYYYVNRWAYFLSSYPHAHSKDLPYVGLLTETC